MALVRCPDCGKEVSDAAPSCPGCGRPMAAAPAPVQVQTTKGSKFLDPAENARGCLRMVMLLFFVGLAAFLLIVARHC